MIKLHGHPKVDHFDLGTTEGFCWLLFPKSFDRHLMALKLEGVDLPVLKEPNSSISILQRPFGHCLHETLCRCGSGVAPN